MNERIIFLRVAWMNAYQGVQNDSPIGAGWWVAEHNDGGEVANFYSISDRLYGYAEIQNNRSLRIQRLGAGLADEKIENVTIVFFAKNPVVGGQFIIGWYKQATLFRNRQMLDKGSRLDHLYYFCTALKRNAHLIPTPERTFAIPTDGPGQTNAWYIEEYHDRRYLQEVRNYLNGKIIPKRSKKGKWKADFEAKRRVEYAAMEAVAAYFEERGYDVSYVHTENLGWDMEARSDSQMLKLEVKGLSLDFSSVELTPNEYAKSKSDFAFYRICVVSNALKANAIKVEIFAFRKDLDCWVNEQGVKLTKKEIISARFTADIPG